jgi:hypothetical protein
VAALLAALATLPALVVALRQGPARAGPGRSRVVGVVAVAAVVAVALLGAEQLAGASSVGAYEAADPCTAGPDPYPGSGLDAVGQRIALSALNGAACDLHTTRERLVLSLDPKSGYTDVTWDNATRERALRSGTRRAIDDAEHRGTLPGWAATVLRFTADHAPVTWILEHLPI